MPFITTKIFHHSTLSYLPSDEVLFLHLYLMFAHLQTEAVLNCELRNKLMVMVAITTDEAESLTDQIYRL